MANPLTNANSARPSSLKNPVPGKAQQDEVELMLAEFNAPEVSAPVAEAAPPDEVDSILNSIGEPAPMVGEVPTVVGESPTERMSRTGSVGQTAKEIVGDTVARFQANFGVTDKERIGKLKQIYGEQGVRQAPDGTLQIRREGEPGFRDFDPDTGLFSLDVINDIADLGRDVVEGGAAAALRFAGAKSGARGSAKVPGGAAKQALMTGLEAGADGIFGLQVGDFIAEKLIGIQRDPSRNALKEAALVGGVGMGIGSVFGLASSALARRRIAQEARKGSVAVSEVMNAADEVRNAADSLERNGINLKQGKLTLSPGQIAGDLSPESKSLDFELSDEGKVRDFFVEQGKLVKSGWDKLKQGITNVTGKSEEDLFRSVKNASKTAREVEGKTIGTFRDQALRASDGRALPMGRTLQSTPALFGELGFSVGKDGKALSPSFDHLQEMFPDASPAVLGKLKTLVGDLEGTLRKNGGRLPLKETDRLYGSFRDTIDNFWGSKNGHGVAKKLVDIKNALRDDWTQHIGAELETKVPNALDAYRESMQKYSGIMQAQDTLRNVLKKRDLSSAAFADQIFSKAQGKDRIAQLKSLINETDPDLFPQLVDQKLSLMQAKAMNNKTGRIDWRNLSKQFDELQQSEILDQMVTPEQKSNLRSFFKVAEKVDSSFSFKEGVPVGRSQVAAVRNLIITLGAPVSFITKLTTGQNMAQSTLESIGKDKALVKWLNGEGLELVLKDVPKKQQSEIRSWLIPMIRTGVINSNVRDSQSQPEPEK